MHHVADMVSCTVREYNAHRVHFKKQNPDHKDLFVPYDTEQLGKVCHVFDMGMWCNDTVAKQKDDSKKKPHVFMYVIQFSPKMEGSKEEGYGRNVTALCKRDDNMESDMEDENMEDANMQDEDDVLWDPDMENHNDYNMSTYTIRKHTNAASMYKKGSDRPFSLYIFAFCRSSDSKPFAMTGCKYMFLTHAHAFGLPHYSETNSETTSEANMEKDMKTKAGLPMQNRRASIQRQNDKLTRWLQIPHQYALSGKEMFGLSDTFFSDYKDTENGGCKKVFASQLCLVHQLCAMFPMELGKYKRMLRILVLQQFQAHFALGTGDVQTEDICFMTHLLNKTKEDINPFWWTVPYM